MRQSINHIKAIKSVSKDLTDIKLSGDHLDCANFQIRRSYASESLFVKSVNETNH